MMGEDRELAKELLANVADDVVTGLCDLIVRARKISEVVDQKVEFGGGRECDLPGDYVYLIRADNGLYKIGVSKTPHHRLEMLRGASPVGLELAHTIRHLTAYPLENLLHHLFEDKRHHGEWFALDAIDVTFIAGLNQSNATLICTGSEGLWGD